MARVIAADIGGTNIRLALEDDGEVVRRDVLPSRDFADGGVSAAFARFLGDEGTPTAACVGYAGAIRDGRAVGTNVPFAIDEAVIGEESGIGRVRVLNDLEAAAYGLMVVPQEDVVDLIPGEGQEGSPMGIVAPGTGLGEATLLTVDGRPHVVPMEGGQAGFSPIFPELHRLAGILEQEVGPVRVEDVVSGPGIMRIHSFVRQVIGTKGGDHADPAAITAAALEGDDAAANQCLQLFVGALGFEARNLAVRTLAYGGIYLAGGIVPDILEALRWPVFREAFCESGRSSSVVEGVPVRAVMGDQLGLLGALSVARALTGS